MLTQSPTTASPALWLLRKCATLTESLWRRTGLMQTLRFRQQTLPRLEDLKTALSELADTSKPEVTFPSKQQKIVVVGGGPAAVNAVKWAKQRGFSDVVLVQDGEQDIGGKCVNRGCMPSEFFMAAPQLSTDELNDRFTAFRNRLRSAIQKDLQTLCSRIVYQRAVAIKENLVLTETGETVAFDVVILANGQEEPSKAKGLSDALSLNNFWELKNGPLTIVIDGSLTGLSLASMAQKRGIAVRVLILKHLPFGHLPAVKFFLESLQQDGIPIEFVSRIESLSKTEVVYISDSGARQHFNHSSFIYQNNPDFSGIPVDGQEWGLQEIDFRWLKLKKRSNVFIIGDAAGFLSAMEAEVSGQALIDMWCEKVPVATLMPSAIPLRIHAKTSLAMVGDPLTYLQDHWHQVDFSLLGWTAVHQRNGALWFQCDPKKAMVTALHICHPDAGELIALGSALMRFPVFDPLWSSAFAHPSSGEIFRLVRARVLEMSQHPLAPELNTQLQVTIRRKDIKALTHSSQSASEFSPAEINLGKLDQDPREYFVVLFGLKALMKSCGDPSAVRLKRSPTGELVCSNDDDLNVLTYLYNPSVPAAKISWKGRAILVKLI